MFIVVILSAITCCYYSYQLGLIKGHSKGYLEGMDYSDVNWNKALKNYTRKENED